MFLQICTFFTFVRNTKQDCECCASYVYIKDKRFALQCTATSLKNTNTVLPFCINHLLFEIFLFEVTPMLIIEKFRSTVFSVTPQAPHNKPTRNFLFKLKHSNRGTKITAEYDGDDTMLRAQAFKWHGKFEKGKMTLGSTNKTVENVKHVSHKVHVDCHPTVENNYD